MPQKNIADDFERWKVTNALVQAAAARHGVDSTLIQALIMQESDNNPRAVSNKGAQGMMQLMPATAKELGVTDPFNQEQNIEAGTKYLSQLLKRYQGDQTRALAAYNAGMGAVESGRAARFPETQDYVKRIENNRENLMAPTYLTDTEVSEAMQRQAQQKPQAAASAPAASTPDQPFNIAADFEQWKAGTSKPPAAPAAPKNVRMEGWTDRAIESLPEIGATVGGTLGGLTGGIPTLGVGAGPGAVIGAGFLGAGGEAFKQLINRARGQSAPATPLDAAKDIGYEGGKQAVIQKVGDKASKLLYGAGKHIVQRVFKPSAKLLEKAPGLVDDLIEFSVSPSAKGVTQEAAATTASRRVADTMVKTSGAAHTLPSGVKVTPHATIQEILDALIKNPYDPKLETAAQWAARQYEKEPAKRRLFAFIQDVVQSNQGKLTFERVQDIARVAGKKGADAYKSELPSLEKMLHADVATGARHALETRIPGLSKANETTRRHLMALRAAKNAKNRIAANAGGVKKRHLLDMALTYGAHANPEYIPHALATAVVAHVAAKPTVQAFAGRTIAKVGSKVPFANLLRAGSAALGPQDVRENRPKQRKRSKPPQQRRVDAIFDRANAEREP
jgi:hypothetical protein